MPPPWKERRKADVKSGSRREARRPHRDSVSHILVKAGVREMVPFFDQYTEQEPGQGTGEQEAEGVQVFGAGRNRVARRQALTRVGVASDKGVQSMQEDELRLRRSPDDTVENRPEGLLSRTQIMTSATLPPFLCPCLFICVCICVGGWKGGFCCDCCIANRGVRRVADVPPSIHEHHILPAPTRCSAFVATSKTRCNSAIKVLSNIKDCCNIKD